MADFICDKLEKQYTFRIPEVLEKYIKDLSPSEKKRMHEEIIRIMAKMVHDSRFDPSLYTSSE